MALTDNLVSCFQCEEASGADLVDAVGGTNTATATNTAASTAGKVGNARVLTGGQFFTKTSPTFPSGATQPITLAGWLRATDPSASWNTFQYASMGKYRNTGNQRQILGPYLNSAVFEGYISGNGTSATSVSASTFGAIAKNVWYFVCLRYDHANSLWKISVNAGTVDTVSYSSGIFAGTAPFEVGIWDAIQAWYGDIDQLLIYSRSISDAEVTALYNGGAGLSYAAMSTRLRSAGSFG